MTKKSMASSGFTLIELLVVIVIISVLAVTVLVALNPPKRIRDAKDDRRLTDVDSILTAVHQYFVDSKGTMPAGLSSGMVEKQLGTATSGCAITTGGCNVTGDNDCVNLTSPLANYLQSIPIDPNGNSNLTGYSIVVSGNNMVTVKACSQEGGSNLWMSR